MSGKRWGGKRSGAGRPVESRTLQTQQMRDRFVALCYEKSDEIFDALITAALGSYEVKTGNDTVTRVYLKPPDVPALREVCNRIWGLPRATVDLSAQVDVTPEGGLWDNPEIRKITLEYEEQIKRALIG